MRVLRKHWTFCGVAYWSWRPDAAAEVMRSLRHYHLAASPRHHSTDRRRRGKRQPTPVRWDEASMAFPDSLF